MKPSDPSNEKELRSEIRQAAEKGTVVEFRPSRDAMIYQLTLRDWSPSGLGILVKKESRIYKLLEVGQVIPMAVHLGDDRTRPEYVSAEVRHISEPVEGQHPNHSIIGLYMRVCPENGGAPFAAWLSCLNLQNGGGRVCY